ncbi:MAG: CehA/McbA family metallohydrolase [candidate division KSB1 bacterium]|nr:CehA/McbA family metallohydrolase [candidate division KSB1 bacterium]MDZ7312335.1 CehA/McbA family metallohydrolase [candidate division KSB1 bacterium]
MPSQSLVALPFSLSHDLRLLLIPFWLYAEIHYRFKFIPSRLFYRQPEIIADAPHRIDPGQPLPILLLVKDANRFPIELQGISATIELNEQNVKPRSSADHPPCHSGRIFLQFKTFARNGKRFLRDDKATCAATEGLLQDQFTTFKFLKSPEPINSPFWWRTFSLEVPESWRGKSAQVNIEIVYRCNGRQFCCYNDNHVGTSQAPQRIYFANDPLPTLPDFWHGELHCHTDATSDQVEFGAPVEAMVELAKAQGLKFFAATDHSYDLDDLPDNYLKNDPALRKWHGLYERITQCNEQNRDFVIIPGEEVSTGNSRRRNVHFLIFNSPQFFPGNGDSAERWFRTGPEMSITDILDELGDEALAFAAHPEVPTPFLEWLLLRRGQWQWPDYQHPRLNGLQIWNGSLEGMEEGLARWRELLLAGKKVFIIAGNDAHGNFNRFRQVGIPHLRMREHHWHVFGRTRTAVLINGQISLPSLMAALRNGRACITTGPMMDLQIICENGRRARLGETVTEPMRSIAVQAESSPEFGKLTRLVVWLGDLQERREQVLFETNNFGKPFSFSHTQPLHLPAGQFYVRGEVQSAGSEFLPEQRLPCQASTNPIWAESRK